MSDSKSDDRSPGESDEVNDASSNEDAANEDAANEDAANEDAASSPKSATLDEALDAQGIELDEQVRGQLDAYCRLLWQWNEKINLTRHLDYDAFVTRDLVDTTQLANLLNSGEDVMDFGSGGGVPGITLAILRPDLKLTLCESVGKKTKVLENMVQELGLSVSVVNDRAEKVLEDFRYDALTARAVGPLWKICTWFQPHWPAIVRVLAIKGPRWVEERGEARHRGLLHDVEMRCVAKYPMAGTDSESVILKLWHKGRPEPAI